MSDHLCEIRYSTDGGHNWSNWRTADLGDVGQFAKRVVFRRFGSSRSFIFQERVSGPIKCDLMAAEIMIRKADM